MLVHRNIQFIYVIYRHRLSISLVILLCVASLNRIVCFLRENSRYQPPRMNADQIAVYKTRSAEEIVTIVDENNQVIGSKTRKEMRALKLIHRATYAFIKNSKNMFYVQKRTPLKDYCPCHFDATPGGVVAAGESYEETNKREIEEEMGIPQSIPTLHLFTFFYEDDRVRCFGDAWEIAYDGETVIQEEEVESVQLMSMEEIIERHERGEPFTPDSIHACKRYIELYGCPKVIENHSPLIK